MTDFKDLLVRYIQHVRECEGSSALWPIYWEELERRFSAAEIDELRQLEECGNPKLGVNIGYAATTDQCVVRGKIKK